MHFTVYIIPPAETADDELDMVTEHMLDRYDQGLAVEPYRVHPGEDELRRMAEHYDISLPARLDDLYAPVSRAAHVGSITQALAGRAPTTVMDGAHPALGRLRDCLPDWQGVAECGIDAEGLYYESTYNPEGQWDYWSPIDVSTEWPDAAAGNIIRCDRTTPVVYAVITPDGEWHSAIYPSIEAHLRGQQPREDYLARVQEAEQEWTERCHLLLEEHEGMRMAVVDCHS